MTDTESMAALVAAVEAENETAITAACRKIATAHRDRGEYFDAHTVVKAFDGDMNAAVRLVEALLPGWVWTVSGKNWGAVMDHDGSDDLRDLKHFSETAANPARALLLAVLRAKIEAE